MGLEKKRQPGFRPKRQPNNIRSKVKTKLEGNQQGIPEEPQGGPRSSEESRGSPRRPEEPRGVPRSPEEPRRAPRSPEEAPRSPCWHEAIETKVLLLLDSEASRRVWRLKRKASVTQRP